jgi:hypothetical protein
LLHRSACLFDLLQVGQGQGAFVVIEPLAAQLHLAALIFDVALIGRQDLYLLLHLHHLQALLQYYIEGASFIPLDDIWNYFLVYMDKKLVAFATTFEEYLKVPKAAVTIS